MQDLIPFDFQGNALRVILVGGDPWFALADVCTALDLSNPSQVASRLDEDALITNEVIDSMGRPQSARFVSEPGLYEVIATSRSPKAKPFKRWLFSEVLPSIRKTGSYGKPSLDLTSLDSISALLDAGKAALNRAIEAESRVQELAPKAAFADAVATSHTSILVGDLAKILKGNGLDIGANRLFARLREEGYLIRRNGTDWNMPTQKSMELGLFEVKETVVKHADGHSTISKTPKVTGKGQTYFIQRYLSRDLSESEAR